ncbi:MerR family transcriptional regulator [Kibdelosporangium phytohabitans]|uniref:MerR family transcriptional regulator n=1 Tax=Kibdelosporangium phytohabitans TaxID=860235 RepID=UPI0009F857A6|nr:DNA-binding transcriptional regulator YbjK/DNA-binding transcriptional MerR regulator [Kibdelosporangium phytohabitans]
MTDSVRIGEAAALYGLSASTLRWWEEQGVLGSPERVDGRRRYDDQDLRRLGLAYLCCVVGMMPLDRAAVVTSVGIENQRWRHEVRAQAERLRQRIAQLESARDYLLHLMVCTKDDPSLCPDLDEQLVVRTPRGRVDEPDLPAAARVARRYVNRADDDENPGAPTCPACRAPVPKATRGRPRAYCSPACTARGAVRRQDVDRGTGRYRQPVTDGRKLKGERRKRELIEATLRVVAKEGVAGVSHRTVAREAGQPATAAAYYFEGIDDLLTAALTSCMHEDADRIRQAATVRAVAENMAEALKDPGRLLAEFELFLRAARNPDLRRSTDRWLNALADFARRYTDDPNRVHAVVAAIDGLLLQALLTSRPPTAAEFEAVLLTLLPQP